MNEGEPKKSRESKKESRKEWVKTIQEEYGTDKTPQEKLFDANHLLLDVLDKFNSDASTIPTEDYEKFLVAAEIYVSWSEIFPSESDQRRIEVAKAIIAEAPVENAEAE